MYQLLHTGKHPFYVRKKDTRKTLRKKLLNPNLKFAFDEHISAEARHLCVKLCTHEPQERYTSNLALSHP